jgi:hypothetical protein
MAIDDGASDRQADARTVAVDVANQVKNGPLQLDAIARDEQRVIVFKLGSQKHPVAQQIAGHERQHLARASLRSTNSVAATFLLNTARSRVAARLPSRIVPRAVSCAPRTSSLAIAGLFMTIEVT